MHPVIFALKRAHQATQKTIDEHLASYGLSAAQLDVLILLAQSPREQRSVQAALGVTSATTAKLLGAMDEARLIERTASRTDSRVKQVSISRRGRDLLGRLKLEKNTQLTQKLLQGFLPTEVVVLKELLTKVARNMDDTSDNFFV